MYKVEQILDRRVAKGKRKEKIQYLVKWEGWKVSDSTWEPQANLSNVREMIQAYNSKKNCYLIDSSEEIDEISLANKNFARSKNQHLNIDDQVNQENEDDQAAEVDSEQKNDQLFQIQQLQDQKDKKKPEKKKAIRKEKKKIQKKNANDDEQGQNQKLDSKEGNKKQQSIDKGQRETRKTRSQLNKNENLQKSIDSKNIQSSLINDVICLEESKNLQKEDSQIQSGKGNENAENIVVNIVEQRFENGTKEVISGRQNMEEEAQKSQKKKRLVKKAQINRKQPSEKNKNAQTEGNPNQNDGRIIAEENSNEKTEGIKKIKAREQTKILGMKKEKDGKFWYFINEGGIESWASREYVVNNYSVKLCEFYEARVVFME